MSTDPRIDVAKGDRITWDPWQDGGRRTGTATGVRLSDALCSVEVDPDHAAYKQYIPEGNIIAVRRPHGTTGATG